MAKGHPRLSNELDLAILHGMLEGVVGHDAVEPGELSKLGQAALASLRALDKPTYEAVLLHGTDVVGVPRDALRAYLGAVREHGVGASAGAVLQQVRDKQLLVELINEATDQLGKRSIDLALLGGLLAREAVGGPGLESAADR